MRSSTSLLLLALLSACGVAPSATISTPPPSSPSPWQASPADSTPAAATCSASADCKDGRPICDAVTHSCVACDGDWNTSAPHACPITAQRCEGDGSCGECRQASDCAGRGLACLGTTCGACSSDDQCATGRCVSGSCAPTGAVRRVDNSGLCGDALSGDGVTIPYCNPGDAIPSAGQVVIQIAASDAPYASFAIDRVAGSGALDVTIVGPGGTQATIGEGDGDVVHVQTDGDPTTLTLRGVDIAPRSHTQGWGVSCQGSAATVSLSESIVEGVAGGGISSTGCALTLDRSVVRHNVGGGIQVDFGTFAVTASVVADNEGGGVHATHAQGTLSHVTVANNVAYATTASAAGVWCDLGATVDVADSIVAFNGLPKTGGVDVSGANNVDPHCTLERVATGAEGVLGDACDPVFVDAPHGDYHLDVSPAAVGDNYACTLDQGSSTPWLDLDGKGLLGASSDLGADEAL